VLVIRVINRAAATPAIRSPRSAALDIENGNASAASDAATGDVSKRGSSKEHRTVEKPPSIPERALDRAVPNSADRDRVPAAYARRDENHGTIDSYFEDSS